MADIRRVLLQGPYARLTLRLKNGQGKTVDREYRFADMNEPTLEAAEQTLRKALSAYYGWKVPAFARRVVSLPEKKKPRRRRVKS